MCDSKHFDSLSLWISVLVDPRQSDDAMAARRTTASRPFKVKLAACAALMIEQRKTRAGLTQRFSGSLAHVPEGQTKHAHCQPANRMLPVLVRAPLHTSGASVRQQTSVTSSHTRA